MRIYKFMSFMLSLSLIFSAVPTFAAEMKSDNAAVIDYPYKTYDNSGFMDEIMKPDIKYPANSDVIDEATISAAQMVSMNDISGSYFSYSAEETKKRAWASAVPTAYTIVDWRTFNSTSKADIYDVFRVADDNNGYFTQQSRFNADQETKRAVNILGNRAFIPENIDMGSGKAYINEITLNTKINKTEALTAIYKAVGTEVLMPPIISYGNLDGQVISDSDSGKKEIKYTSLASMDIAQRYAYYAVAARNARNYVYQSSNLVEGYLWQALQDGVISFEHLNENGLRFLKKYQHGEFSRPVSTVNTKSDVNMQNDISSPERFSLAYLVGINKADGSNKSSIGNLVSRYRQPVAFKNESISLVDFCVLLSQVMHIQGEAVMTESEQKMLTAAYGSALPESMSAEYYNTMLYLAARGIIDDSYTAEMLYKPLTWRDMYILLSRVADKDSRLTFKTVTLPYDLEMAEDGFMAVTPAITHLRPMDIESNIEDGTYKDIFIEKNSYTTFKNKNGKETDPFISKQFASPMPSYGVLMDNNFKDSYYWFRIYNSVPVPSCYKDDSAKDTVIIPTTKQAVHCYSIMANDSSKVLYVENTSINNGIYQYYNEDGICKYNGYMIEPSQLATISGVDGITLTAEDDEKVSEQDSVLFTFKLGNNIDLDSISINGLSKAQWTECENISVQTELGPPDGKDKCEAVWVDYKSEENFAKFAIYVEGNTPDNFEAVVASKIQYSSESENGNYLAYVKRNSSRDVYYSISFLKKELGAVLYKNFDNNGYVLQMPDEKIIIEYKNTGGWLCYSGNSILKFNSAIPAIKEMDREDTVDRYLVHGLLVEHYLRANAKRGWSAYVGTDGYLHISSAMNGAEMTFKNVGAITSNFLTPTDGNLYVSGAGNNSYLYEYEGQGTYWLDLRGVPSPISNYIVFWEIGGSTEARASIISFVPMLGEDVKADTDILSDLLSLSNTKITQTDSWGLEYLSAMKFGNGFAENGDDTTVIGGWTLSNLLRYDDKTFTLMYQVPTTDGIDLSGGLAEIYKYKSNFSDSIKWRLPYVYEKDINRVWFMNLPLLSDMTAYKDDVDIAANGVMRVMRENPWVDRIISACKDRDAKYEKAVRKWYPVMPLSDLFTSEVSKEKSFEKMTFAQFHSKYVDAERTSNAAALIGPYQLRISGLSSEAVEFTLNDFDDVLPKWACTIYGNENNDKISVKADTFVVRAGDTDLFMPAKSTMTYDSRKNDFQQLSMTAVKLNSVFANSLKDMIDLIYLEEKELDEKFKDANSIVALMYLFAVAVIPRILFGFLFVFQILALLVKVKYVRLFCEKVVDVYKILTFGRISYDRIDPVKLWLTGSVGSIIIILISRNYGSYIIAKIISLVLHLFEG
ncbi:MAG: hypothetical protein IJ736_01125 [Firmicutes bacterium]|nr:hypothetical protein [Bacillota bacterium]